MQTHFNIILKAVLIGLGLCLLTQASHAQSTTAQIAVGAYHSVVLDEKGDVYTFGAGVFGELGHGGDKRMDIARPIDHPALAGKTIVDISASQYHILYLTDEGEVFATGGNGKSAFGPQTADFGPTNIAQIPHAALDTATIVRVYAGFDFSYLLSENGTVFTMGENNHGYLGTGFTGLIPAPTPLNLTNLNGEKVIHLSTSFSSRLILTDANNLYATGSNSNGQFGNDATNSTTLPVASSMAPFAGKTIQNIYSYDGASRVITTDGSLYTMGNYRAALGMGNITSDILSPTLVTHPSLEGKAFSSAAVYGISYDGTVLVATDGSVFVIGDNPNGRLGKGDFANTDTSWTKIPASYFDHKPIVEAALGGNFSLFRASDGTMYGAGQNAGTGYSSDLTRPLPINTTFLDGRTITKIVAGNEFALLLSSDGQVFMFSTAQNTTRLFSGSHQQLAIIDRNSIKAVPTKLTHPNLEGHSIVDVKAGAGNTYFLTSEGKVFSFGDGSNGTLGNGDSLDVYVPTLITHANLNGKKIIDIATNGNATAEGILRSHTLLLADDGTLFAMGSNSNGQLGVGDFQNRFVPTPVTANLSGKTIVKIAVGPLNSMAIASDGTVFLWGEGGNDEMGFGNTDDLNVPTHATHVNVGGKKIIDGAIGYLSTSMDNSRPHFLFLNEDHDVYSMGENVDGQLGLGYKNTTIVTTPQPVVNTMLSGETIAGLSAGLQHSMLRTESGKLYAWGTVRRAGFNTSSITDYVEPTIVESTDVTNRNVIAIITQHNHGLALLDDGTVLSFGQVTPGTNPFGAIGNGFLNEGKNISDYPNQLLLTKIANFTTYVSPIPTTQLALHLDAGRVGYIASNDSVNTWINLADTTQNAVHPGLDFRPLLVDSAINDRPAMRFNGTDSYFTLPTTADLGIQNNDYEVFMVAKSASSNQNVAFLLGGAISEFELKMNIGVGLRFNPRSGIWEDLAGDGAFTDGTTHLFNAWANSSQIRVNVNRTGSTQNINGHSSYASGLNLGIGLDYTPQYHFEGDIAEVIIYDKVLSAEERTAVETHLFAKYAIQNYKNESAQLTGTEGWRLLSSPVADSSYASFFRGLWTQGFTGATVEHGASNVYTWPLSSVGRDSTQWIPLSDGSATFSPGQGVLMYVFSDDDGPDNETNAGFPKVLRADGFSPSTDVSLNSRLNPNLEGWSLVGNPYTTNINWDLMAKTNLSNSVYVWDNTASEWKTWNGTLGGLTDGLIGPFNGFFVETLNENPELSVPLTARADGNSVFLGKETTPEPFVLELEVRNEENRSNSTWLSFSEAGLPGKDAFDALKLLPFSPEFIQIASADAEGKLLDINELPLDFDLIEIPIHIRSTYSGVHDIRFSNVVLPDDWTLALVDTKTGEEIDVEGIASFEHRATMQKAIVDVARQPEITTQSAAEPRFMLRIERGPTSIERDTPIEFALGQNYPNPFNPSTTIKYALPEIATVRLDVYDMLGRRVATLVNNDAHAAGYHTVIFDASRLASGVYIYRLQAGSTTITRKLTLIK